MSFSFVAGFVAKMQDPSSSAPWFESVTVPALPNSSTNCNGRLVCPVQVVRCYLDCTAAHRPRCERMFDTAGCSKKEISNNIFSFWLWTTIALAYQLLVGPHPAHHRKPGRPEVLLKELRCHPGVEGGYLAQTHNLHAPLPARSHSQIS